MTLHQSVGSVAVLILTHNEEKNIAKCIESILPLTRRIFVVDSGSDDDTVYIARRYGAEVAVRKWTTHAEQFNWGLEYFDFQAEWIMRIDADEELTPGLVKALQPFLASNPRHVSGVYVRRRVYFLGRWIKHGGYYPTWLLRLFRAGVGRCEALRMDEHIIVGAGETVKIYEDILDNNNKDLTFWTDKHNQYANREVLDVVEREKGNSKREMLVGSLSGSQANSRRWFKTNIYGNAPLFWRAFAYFCYRYFFRLGFLDGKEGLVFHFLQGFWYRFLVDAKLYEYEKQRRVLGK